MRITSNARALFSGAGAAAIGVAVVACIPDLPEMLGPGDGSTDGLDGDASSGDEVLIPAGCGDGVIDLAAGEQCDPSGGSRGGPVAGCNPDCTMMCSSDAGFLWPKNHHCYEFIDQPASSLIFGADRGICRMLPGRVHVATFASEEEFTQVASKLDAGWFWVGLQEPGDVDDYTATTTSFEPGWSAPCTGCYAHTPNATTVLPKGSVMGSGGAYCVQGSSDLGQKAWQKVPCSGIDPGIRVVCEREPVGSHTLSMCDAGTCFDLVWTYGRKTYVYGQTPLSADGAEQACRALGGRLIVLATRDEREQLWKELAKLSFVPTSVWIGLSIAPGALSPDAGAGVGDAALEASSDAGNASGWVWDDGTPAEAYPSPWGWGRPHTGADKSTRAYLYSEEPPASDNTLARNDGPMPTALPYVCELELVDGGALRAAPAGR